MKKYLAELIGTFILVFGGCGAAVFSANFSATASHLNIGFLGVALAFGLTVLGCAYALGPISGCHLNPAVTIGLAVGKRFAWREAPAYIVAQVVGAVVAAGMLLVLLQAGPGGYDPSVGGLAANGYAEHSPGGYSMVAGLLGEILLTFIFLTVILGATAKKAAGGFAGIPIGLTLTLVHLVGIPLTNLSVNPARSTGPALFVGGWAIAQLWLFWLAPLIGAALAGFVSNVLQSEEEAKGSEATAALATQG
jgi:aquaporin Z